MDNSRFKVELWTDEIAASCKESKLLHFHSSDEDVLRITNSNYEKVFSYLTNRKTLLISGEDEDADLVSSSTGEEDETSLHVSKSKIKNDILDRLIEKNKKSLEKYGRITTYVSFGILDYTEVDHKHEVKSAPLVFIPVMIEKIEDKNTYQIYAVNDELCLNENLISYMQKNRNISLKYPISSTFSLLEYLTFIAPKAYMYHWSINNGVFLTDFDLTSQRTVDDYITNQDKIIEVPLIKSITYYNSEFYSFNQPKGTKLSRKLLSLLPLDNEEYRIMQKVANRENLFIRTDGLANQSHLINNMISAFLINNKKVLVVYNEKSQKDALFSSLDSSLIPYCQDFNEFSIDKDAFLDRICSYDNYQYQRKNMDPMSMQEILNQYYEVRNDFKKTINSLRKKHTLFGLSLSEIIENYYRYQNDMIDIKIPHIGEMTPAKIEEYLGVIHEFENTLKALKTNYKDHPFYGFDKKIMMQEEYLPLKTAFTVLTENLKKMNTVLLHFHERFEFPYANNLKLTKALLNILSVVPTYKNYPSSFFEDLNWDGALDNINLLNGFISQKAKEEEDLKSLYGDKVFDLDYDLIKRVVSENKLTRKEGKALSSFLNKVDKLTVEYIVEVKNKLDEHLALIENIKNLSDALNLTFNDYFKDSSYDYDEMVKVKESVDLYRHAVAYFAKNRLPFSLKPMEMIKDESVYEDMMKYRTHLQVLFNEALDNTNKILPYFNKDIIDFETLPFDQYFHKADRIAKEFNSINQYLDFYMSLHRMNQMLPNLGNKLLEIEDYSLYENMFMKRFYYDYAQYLMNSLRKNTYNDAYIFGSIETYQKSEADRKTLFESFINNYYVDFLQARLAEIRRSELTAVEKFKDTVGLRPLSWIASMVPESIYHMFPCLVMPLTSVASLCKADQFHFDALIILASRSVQTKETLSSLFRSDQTIVFDTQWLTRDPKTDYIDKGNIENFISASKRCFENIEFVSKSYTTLPLKTNNRCTNFKKELIKYLKSQGFEVASDITLSEGTLDLVVRMPLRKGYTGITIDSLPYHSIESAMLTFEACKTIVNNAGYSYIRVFPFAFFMDEEKAKQELTSAIIENSMKTIERKKRVVKKKLTDVLFENYIFPAEIYYAYKGKSEISRKDLMLSVLKRTMPLKKDELIMLFQKDALELISLLVAEDKIYEKDGFIFVYGEPITFRSSKAKLRPYKNVHPLEIQDGILRMVNTIHPLSCDSIIKMILLCLGYKKMDAQMYKYINNLILDMTKDNPRLVIEDNMLSIKEEAKA